LKVIKGFKSAKLVLSRKAPVEVFGGDAREQVVRQIIDEVRTKGDRAVIDYTLKLDGVKLTSLEVGKKQITNAYRQVDSEFISALKLAAKRIRSFHLGQKRLIWRLAAPGSVQLRALERVGIYVPGGTASYPSTVLMTAVPARVAGVREIILVTPPRKQEGVSPPTLVAADIAGVDRIFSVGGAQAIAALAFGTKSIPRVDKICGPGNIFVVLAKKLVYGAVAIDGLPGPSEVLVIADETAKPDYCVADLLAQAEHDPLATAILITTSKRLAEGVNQEVERQLKGLGRQAIASESIKNRGLIVVVANIDEAIELANLYAPEHLHLMVKGAENYVKRVANAGCISIGENSTVALGDYVFGPSHVLPTGATARFGSPLNILDFVKLTNLVKVDKSSLPKLGKAAAIIARAEGLEAHARAIEKRLKRSY
jgi:histidinol dehydrogenase